MYNFYIIAISLCSLKNFFFSSLLFFQFVSHHVFGHDRKLSIAAVVSIHSLGKKCLFQCVLSPSNHLCFISLDTSCVQIYTISHIFKFLQPIFLNDVSVKCTDNENNQDDTTFFVCYSDSERIHLRATSATERLVFKLHSLIFDLTNTYNQISLYCFLFLNNISQNYRSISELSAFSLR